MASVVFWWLLPVQAAEALHRTEHYEIYSDAGPDICVKVGSHLETAYKAYRAFIPIPQSAKERFRVRILSTREKFDEYNARAAGGREARKSFVYHHSTREVVGFLIPDAPLLARLRHEAFHQYFRAIVPYPPPWVNEGLAEYFEACEIGEDGSLKARPARGWVRDWREKIRGIEPELSSGRLDLLAIEDLMTMDKETWTRKSASAYPESWALVYWFLHGGDAARKEELLRYLRTLKGRASAGENAKAAFDKVFGKADLPAMERDFLKFMDALENPGHRDFLRGVKLFDQERYAEAIASFDRALEADRGYERYWYFRGTAHYSSSSFARAEEDLKKAIDLFPEYASAHFELGKNYAYMKKFDAARESLSAALKLSPGMKRNVEEWLGKVDEWEKERR